jgi:hypothetical protein
MTGSKQRRQRKLEASHKPADIALNKRRFIAALAKGNAPAVAAQKVGVARSTTYNWRSEDEEFAAAWLDAVELSLDRLETRLYNSAMRGNSSDLQFILKWRRADDRLQRCWRVRQGQGP